LLILAWQCAHSKLLQSYPFVFPALFPIREAGNTNLHKEIYGTVKLIEGLRAKRAYIEFLVDFHFLQD